MSRREEDSGQAAKREAATRDLRFTGKALSGPGDTQIYLATPIADPEDTEGYGDIEDPDAPQLVRILRDWAIANGRDYLHRCPGTRHILVGAHAFPTTRERTHKLDIVALEDLCASELVLPLPWVCADGNILCDARVYPAIEPALLERFIQDLQDARRSEEPLNALCRLAEDPLRYMGGAIRVPRLQNRCTSAGGDA